MNVPAGTMPSSTPTPPVPDAPILEPVNPNPSPPPTQPEPQKQDDQGNVKPLVDGVKPQEPIEFVPLTAEDITFPEGVEVNETLRDEALALFNNRELSPKDQLQGLVDLQAKLAKEASGAISETWENTQKEWQNEVKADPTIGGDKLPVTLTAVNKLVSEYGSPELVEVFEATGAGNNVHVIKFLNTVAGHLTEGKPITPTGPTSAEGTAAERLFPNMNKG